MLVAKMLITDRKAFCVLKFAKTESVVTVHCAFRIRLHCDSPDNNIRRWYHQCEDASCLCKGKSTGVQDDQELVNRALSEYETHSCVAQRNPFGRLIIN